jgi:hypothetical protein
MPSQFDQEIELKETNYRAKVSVSVKALNWTTDMEDHEFGLLIVETESSIDPKSYAQTPIEHLNQ